MLTTLFVIHVESTVWYDPIEQSEWSLWLLGEATEEILVLEKI